MQLSYFQRTVKPCFIQKYNFGVYSMGQQCFLKNKKREFILLQQHVLFLCQLFVYVVSSFSHFTDIWRTFSTYVFDVVTNVSAEHLNKLNCLQENNKYKVLLY